MGWRNRTVAGAGRAVGVLGLVAVGASGCLVERDPSAFAPVALRDTPLAPLVGDGVDDGVGDAGRVRPTVTDVTDAYMQGRVGLGDVDQVPDELHFFDSGPYTAVQTIAVRPERATMLYLSLTTDNDVLRPGFSGTFRGDDLYDPNELVLLGCSGLEVDSYDEFDEPADEVDVVVTEGPRPDQADVALVGRWYARDEHGVPTTQFASARASFTITQQ